MSTLNDVFDEVFGALKNEYDGGKRVKQEEVDRRKAAPQEDSLAVFHPRRESDAGIRQPAVKSPTDNRKGRKRAEEEKITQWEMVQTANRSALGNEAVGAVALHAYKTMDRLTGNISDEFYGVKREEGMNKVMSRVGAKCIALGEAGMMAMCESFLKRIADDL